MKNIFRHGLVTVMIASGGSFELRGGQAPDLQKGSKVFQTTCFVCHGNDGKGALPGIPNLTSGKGPLAADDDLLVSRVIAGYQSDGSPMAMPPRGGNPALSEKDVRDAIAYMKNRFLPKKRD